jgi:hypothetical protein
MPQWPRRSAVSHYATVFSPEIGSLSVNITSQHQKLQMQQGSPAMVNKTCSWSIGLLASLCFLSL